MVQTNNEKQEIRIKRFQAYKDWIAKQAAFIIKNIDLESTEFQEFLELIKPEEDIIGPRIQKEITQKIELILQEV